MASGTPSARSGHVLLSSGGKLYAIGGIPTTIDEFTP
jgi:hypothetical protein